MKRAIEQVTRKYPELLECVSDMEQAFKLIADSYRSGGKLLICGNGGSSADGDHIVGELMKGFMQKRPLPSGERKALEERYGSHGIYLTNHLQGSLPAISLSSQSAFLSAYANDVAPDMTFAQQVYGYGVQCDVLLGISTSGNSKNVIHAMEIAKFKGMRTVGLTGRSGGAMNDLCDVTIRVPYDSTPDVQERHLPIYHCLCILLEEEFFG